MSLFFMCISMRSVSLYRADSLKSAGGVAGGGCVSRPKHGRTELGATMLCVMQVLN